MRCLAASQGPKIRVNAIQPGLLLTEWGQQFPEEKIKAMKEKAALKTCVSIFFFLSYVDIRWMSGWMGWDG